MTHCRTNAPRRAPAAGIAPVAIVLGALLLAGCSSGHIGEDWQCPLAKGGSCASVATADPAVPKTGVARTMMTGEPIRLLPRDMETERVNTPPDHGPGQASPEARSCEADCRFDPFAWLVPLFGAEADDDRPDAQDAKPAMTASGPDMTVTSSDTLAVEPAAAEEDAADDVRTGEVVARIWIAPFVDADGVYREASHVRVVLEPAGWRLR